MASSISEAPNRAISYSLRYWRHVFSRTFLENATRGVFRAGTDKEINVTVTETGGGRAHGLRRHMSRR
eukprot:1857547-Rhodomonas_salina.2